MNIGFHSCTLPNWCYQHGTNEQYTRVGPTGFLQSDDDAKLKIDEF